MFRHKSRDTICNSIHVIVLNEIYFQCLRINDFIIDTTAMVCLAFYAASLKLILSFQVRKQKVSRASELQFSSPSGGRGGRVRMVAGFTTTCIISAYLH